MNRQRANDYLPDTAPLGIKQGAWADNNKRHGLAALELVVHGRHEAPAPHESLLVVIFLLVDVVGFNAVFHKLHFLDLIGSKPSQGGHDESDSLACDGKCLWH